MPQRPRRSSACLLPATTSWRRAKLNLLHMALFSNMSLVFEGNALLSVVFINTRLTHAFFHDSKYCSDICFFDDDICVFVISASNLSAVNLTQNNNLKITLN